jgi:hypothetical protein
VKNDGDFAWRWRPLPFACQIPLASFMPHALREDLPCSIKQDARRLVRDLSPHLEQSNRLSSDLFDKFSSFSGLKQKPTRRVCWRPRSARVFLDGAMSGCTHTNARSGDGNRTCRLSLMPSLRFNLEHRLGKRPRHQVH